MGRIFERWSVAIIFVATLSVCAWFSATVLRGLSDSGMKEAGLYQSVFGLTSILTGFIGAFYGIIASSTSEFIKRIKRTDTFRTYMLYIKRSVQLGIGFSLLSALIVAVEPSFSEQAIWKRLLLVFWLAGMVATFVAFYRVVRNFFLLIDFEPPKRRTAG